MRYIFVISINIKKTSSIFLEILSKIFLAKFFILIWGQHGKPLNATSRGFDPLWTSVCMSENETGRS